MNVVSVSEDRRTMTIRASTGKLTTLRSAAQAGFTAEQVDAAESSDSSHLLPGQINRARRFTVRGRAVFVHVNTGPPAWWLPRLEVDDNGERIEVMVGWLRALAAVTVYRQDRL